MLRQPAQLQHKIERFLHELLDPPRGLQLISELISEHRLCGTGLRVRSPSAST